MNELDESDQAAKSSNKTEKIHIIRDLECAEGLNSNLLSVNHKEEYMTDETNWPENLEIDPTSGLPISHSSPQDVMEIDPTSGLPISHSDSPEGFFNPRFERQKADAPSGSAASDGRSSWTGADPAPGSTANDTRTSWAGADPASTSIGAPSHPWGTLPAGNPAKRLGKSNPMLVPMLVTALVAALIGGLIGGAISSHTVGQSTVVEQFKPNSSYIPRMSDPQSIIQKVEPAVVSIQTESFQNQSGFFGIVGTTQVTGAGTGMIISPNGLVLTNNHVINGAQKVQVNLFGQTKALSATIVGTDPSQDLAVIKIANVSNLPTVTLGNSSKVSVGDSVLAIGNALALEGGLTVTEGIISATGRSITAGDPSGSGTETLSNLLQTDAAINAGNSGGPLVNSSGQVIGMNTAVASSSSGNAPAQNIGFAISINHIKQFLGTLEKGGIVPSTAAYLGVQIQDASQVASQFGLPSSLSGAFVCAIVSGSPANSAGLQAGEVITGYNSKTVTDAQDLSNDVQGSKAGDKVRLSVWNAGSTLSANVTLGVAPSNIASLPLAGQDLCGGASPGGSPISPGGSGGLGSPGGGLGGQGGLGGSGGLGGIG